MEKEFIKLSVRKDCYEKFMQLYRRQEVASDAERAVRKRWKEGGCTPDEMIEAGIVASGLTEVMNTLAVAMIAEGKIDGNMNGIIDNHKELGYSVN